MRKVAANSVLSVDELNVDIGPLKILKDITFATRSGDVRAVIGPTGSGKTTLLNAIAGRQELSSGGIYLSGKPFDKTLRRRLGFVIQQDVFFTSLTLWETLYFTAMVCLPETLPKKEKVNRIQELIDNLDLRKCVKTVVGDTLQTGLSGGEKKRLSIACVLLADPDILILDEPTSGLDSNTAFTLVKQLKNIAAGYNTTVIVTIHQPSSKVYHLFDTLLLLAYGQIAYNGAAHTEPIDFLERTGYKFDKLYNPAEFMLDVLSGDKTSVEELIKSQNILEKEKPEQIQSKAKLLQKGKLDTNITLVSYSSSSIITINTEEPHESMSDRWPTGFGIQFRMLTWRHFKQSKHRFLYAYSVAEYLLLALVAGALFFQISDDLEIFRDRMGLIYMCLVIWTTSIATQAAVTFQPELHIVAKEQASCAYRLSAYYAAKTTSELPLASIVPAVFFVISYWMAGLSGVREFFISLFVFVLNCCSIQGLGFFFGAIISDAKVAAVITLGVAHFGILFSGFISQEVPTWLTWAKYLSHVHYPLSAISIITSNNMEAVRCNLTSAGKFTKCLYNSSEYVTSNDALVEAGIDYPSSFYITILVVLFFIFRIFTYIVLRLKYDRR